MTFVLKKSIKPIGVKMFKKIVVIFLASFLFLQPVFAETKTDQKPQVSASAYVLYNPDNDEVVEGKNENVKKYPASLTKMLTALTVLELCEDLDKEVITVSENAVTSLYGTQSSTAKLKIGEKFSVRQMLYLMLLPSGNDAANALAEHFCGDNRSFAKKMNEKAKEIGMLNSNFSNPHGLHDDNHYTTARDLAVLADAYMQNELLYDIAKCIDYTVPKTNLQAERQIRTTNFMRIEGSGYYYAYATGLKTGNTDNAGRCLAASAEKGNKKFICIFLDVPEVWNKHGMVRSDFLEAAQVFEYAFKTYECVKIADKGTVVSNLPVFETFSKSVDLVLENDVYATLPKSTDFSSLTFDFTPKKLVEEKFVSSPVTNGDVIGNVKLVLDNKVVGSCNAVASKTVTPNGLIVFWHTIDLYVYILLSVIVFLILAFVFLIVRKKIIIYKRKKAKEKRLERRRQMFEEFQKQPPKDYFKMD